MDQCFLNVASETGVPWKIQVAEQESVIKCSNTFKIRHIKWLPRLIFFHEVALITSRW